MWLARLRRVALPAPLALAGLAGCAARPTPPAPPAGQPSAEGAPTLAAAPDRFLTSGDVRLRYREVGRGEPVVLLHGYAGSLDTWGGVADALAATYRVVAVDLRGFGESSRFAEPTRYGAELADDVARLLGHLRVRRAHVVGFAMGANVAAQLALRQPQRIATLALIAGIYRDPAAMRALVAPWIAGLERGQGVAPLLAWADPTLSDTAVTAASRRVMAANDSAALVAVLRAMEALVVPPARAADVHVPTLAIVGSADPLADDTRAMAEWWPDAHLVVVDGATHGALLGTPELLARLRAHLRTTPPPRGTARR